MFGENEVRLSAAPISSAMEWVALLKTASSIGSIEISSMLLGRLFSLIAVAMLVYLDDQIAICVDADAAKRRQHRCGTVLRNESRASERVACHELLSAVYFAFNPTALEVNKARFNHSLIAIARLTCCTRQIHRLILYGKPNPDIDNLHGRVQVAVTIALVVRPVKV